MHVRDASAFTWFEAATRRLSDCEVFAAEFDFAEADEAALAAALRLPGGATLDHFLRPGVWKKLDRHARKKLGTTAEAFRQLHPMNVASALTAALMRETAQASLDETLWNFARAYGKEITGVETFDSQLDTLRKIPFEAHLKNLVWLTKNYGRQKRRVRKMLAWYEAGDIRQLYEAARRDAKGLRRVLLYERNASMTRRFAEIAAQRSLFCAVGAGHLAGEKGMLRLLKNAGFGLEPHIETRP